MSVFSWSREPKWLDQMYNNRALVPDHGEYFACWARQSAMVRRSQPCALDVAYGSGPGQTLDVFPSRTPRGKGAPVLVFIHGGYWRALDKSDHSFLAPGLTEQGACVVIPNYALCPAVTIAGIALQMAQALAWCWRNIALYGGNPRRIVVAGHSAGGHLAAMLLACQWRQVAMDMPQPLVKRALSVSGLFDLEPLVHTPFLQADLRLSADSALQVSPAYMPAPRATQLYAVVGAAESPEFVRQNQLIRQTWGARAVPVCEALAGLNHFSVLEAMTQPGHRLHSLAGQLLRE